MSRRWLTLTRGTHGGVHCYLYFLRMSGIFHNKLLKTGICMYLKLPPFYSQECGQHSRGRGKRFGGAPDTPSV